MLIEDTRLNRDGIKLSEEGNAATDYMECVACGMDALAILLRNDLNMVGSREKAQYR